MEFYYWGVVYIFALKLLANYFFEYFDYDNLTTFFIYIVTFLYKVYEEHLHLKS